MDTAPPRPARWKRIVLGLLVALVAAVAGAVLALDTLLTSRARAAAAELSATLGRPVAVGRVSASLLKGQLSVTGLEVGAAAGEPRPLARVEAVAVEADLWTALRTLAKEVPVRSAVASGVAVEVLALPDGTTNLERLAQALAGPEPATPAAPAGPPADLSMVRVDHLELADGRITFTDLKPGAARPVEVSKLGLVLDHLQAGQPLAATLTAALLAEQPNLEVHLAAGPLPASLQPVLERLTVKLQPVELAPLAPFIPRSVGLAGGRLDLDLALALGAAAPGGTGPTSLKGVAHGQGLRFAAASRPLDAELEADVKGDVARGDLDFSRLELALGGARLTGKGQVLGLLGDAPSAKDFSLTGSGLDPQVLGEAFPALKKALPGEVAGPVGLVLVASGTEAAPAVSVQLELTPVRLAIPGQLAKAAGAPLRVVGTARGQGKGSLSFSAHAELTGADLRPGGQLNKAPGEPMSVAASGTVHPGAPFALALSSLEVRVRDEALKGQLSLSRSKAGSLTAAATLEGARLDLDRLLLDDEAPAAPAPRAPAPAADGGVPASDATAGITAQLELSLGQLRLNGLEARQVELGAALTGGVLSVQKGTFTAAGGAFVLDGTTVTLSNPERPFSAKLKLAHLDVKQALAVLWPGHEVAEGLLDGTATLTGAQRSLAGTASGQLEGTLHDGTFVSLDAVGAVVGPLVAQLPFMKGLTGGRAPARGTALGTIPLGLTLEKGTALLKAPLVARTPEAVVTFSGGVALDGTLRMPVKVELTPQLISTVTRGKATVDAPLPVTFNLGGPAWQPRVESLDLKPAVGVLVAAAAKFVVGQAVDGLGGLLGGGRRPAAPDAGTPPPNLGDTAGKMLKDLLGR